MKKRILVIVLWLFLAACSTSIDEPLPVEITDITSKENEQFVIPDAYAGLTNPIEASEPSFSRGAETYSMFCASCHGNAGFGDGPASASLEPAPANLAESGQLMNEDYLYWRISEGGLDKPFNSAMPSWKSSLDETDRWDIVNFIQSLGQEEATN